MDLLKGVTGAVTNNVLPPIWHSGICDCTADTGICLQTWCCTLCTLSNIQNQRDFKIGAFDCGTCCAIMFGAYITGNDLINWMSFGFRRELIQRYGILEEAVCKSCALALCCMPCSLCQVQREMAKRHEHCGGCCANPPPPVSMSDKIVGSVANVAIGAVVGGGLHAPRVWGSGVCGCSCMECLEGIFCPCLIVGYMNHRLNAGRTLDLPLGAPNGLDVGSCCGSLAYMPAYIYANRREIIERYNVMSETHTSTCCNVLCCTVCVLCQQRREMGFANEWPGGLCVSSPPPRPANPPH